MFWNSTWWYTFFYSQRLFHDYKSEAVTTSPIIIRCVKAKAKIQLNVWYYLLLSLKQKIAVPLVGQSRHPVLYSSGVNLCNKFNLNYIYTVNSHNSDNFQSKYIHSHAFYVKLLSVEIIHNKITSKIHMKDSCEAFFT